ncbi:MAG: cation diffusion facilitator family transporter [Syntrophobacteraceae bacterium]
MELAGHCGHHHNTTSGRKMWLSLGITLFFCLGEAVAGLLSHSLALLSDSGHNLSDALALGLAAYAIYAVRKPVSGRHTYGFHRVPILTALFNASTLVVIALFIGIEAFQRFLHPESVDGTLMIWVALAALLMNTAIAAVLHGDARHSLNNRAAFIHMASDAISSLAVIVAGIAIHYTRWHYADPLASLLIAAFILYSATGIVKDAADILMEKAPKNIDLEALVESIKSIPPVCMVHHVHLWTVGDGINVLSCHVALPASCTLEHSTGIIETINKKLHDDFSIGHATIQIETDGLCGISECRLESHDHEHEHEHSHEHRG